MTLSTDITTTIIPWLLGGLLALTALSSALTIYSWRESKRSPYYFLRRQAEQQMQTYSLTTIGLLIGMLFVGTYAWQGPQDTTLRVALIDNAKPALIAEAATDSLANSTTITDVPLSRNSSPLTDTMTDSVEAVAEDTAVPESVVLEGNTFAELASASSQNLSDRQINDTPTAALDDTAVELDVAEPAADVALNADEANLEASLPPEYMGLDWDVDMDDNTTISELTFSDDVDGDLRPTNPSRLFEEGFYTIYATFDYEGMADGMSWSWVWRRDGQVINGGHELWSYGDDGPGYVFLNPQEGFSPGQYVVEVWVNEELMTQANLFVTADAAANN